MKKFKFLSSAAFAMLMLFFSCNSGSETTDKTNADSATAGQPATTEQTTTAEKPVMTMLIKHKVANFNKWMSAYEGHDSVRVAYGLHNFVVSRGLKDSNMVMVALHMDDTARAKEFAMMPDLKTAMQKAGVVGAPNIKYTQTEWHDTAGTNSSTTRVILYHKVKDWDAWKKAFDSHKQTRMNAGLTDRAVGHFVGDPHMVSLVFAVSDMKKAEYFMKSKDLEDKMMEAGVVGAPDIFFYRVAKQW